MSVMIIIILLVLLAVCQVLGAALEYSQAEDEAPGKWYHKVIGGINRWLGDKEETVNA